MANFKKKQKQQKPRYNINGQIKVGTVRLVGDNIGALEICTIQEAIQAADNLGLDLVEISPNANPPVCKIADYQKLLFQQKKKQKAPQKSIVKEMRFGPNISEHDYEFKKNHVIKFLKDGAKVKALVAFKGRAITYKEKGELLLLRLSQDVEEYGKVEQLPKLEGNRMIMHIASKGLQKNKNGS